jgi:hypothetical protein
MTRCSIRFISLVLTSALAACSSEGSKLEIKPVDEDARSAALASIATKCDEIGASGQDPAAQNRAIAEFLLSLPEIAHASVSTDGVVALFTDAQPIIILNNFDPGDLQPISARLLVSPTPSRGRTVAESPMRTGEWPHRSTSRSRDKARLIPRLFPQRAWISSTMT